MIETERSEGTALAERLGSEAFFRLRLVPYRAYEYISPGVERLVGYGPAEFKADPGFVREIVLTEERERLDELDLTRIAPGHTISLRVRHREGRVVWIEVSFWPVIEHGVAVALEGSIREASELKRALVSLEGVRRLLGVGFDGMVTVDIATLKFTAADQKARTLLGAEGSALDRLTLGDIFEPTIAERIATSAALVASGQMDRATFQADVRSPGRAPRQAVVRVIASEDGPSRVQLVFEDHSSERLLTAQKGQFESAVAAATDAIALFDSSHSFIFVNSAFCKLSGFSSSECIGFRPDVLRALLPERTLWTAVSEQAPWSGVIWGVGKGDRKIQIMVSLSPIRASEAGSHAFVLVAREVDGDKPAQAALSRERAARQRLTAALSTLDDGAPVEDLATALCSGVLALPDVAAAVLLDTAVPEEPRLLAIRPETGFEALSRYLILPAKVEGFLELLVGTDVCLEPAASLAGRKGSDSLPAGASLLAVLPLRHEGRTVGLLATLGSDELRDEMRSLGDLARAAAGLLYPELTSRAESRGIRRELQAALTGRAFRPIFQPIIGMEDLSTVGWEATTRFADGKSSAIRFAEAARVGMTVDLEVAATSLAISEVALNAPPGWLSLNVSGAFVASGTRLVDLLPASPRQVVLELANLTDLDETARRILRELPENVRLAVDFDFERFADAARHRGVATDVHQASDGYRPGHRLGPRPTGTRRGSGPLCGEHLVASNWRGRGNRG